MADVRSMSRAERRAADAYLRAENAKWPEALKFWPKSEWPDHMCDVKGLLSVYRSRDFLVQVFEESAPVYARMSVIRTSIKKDGSWKENITWEELQRLKSEVGYGFCDAVEVYPRDVDVVNVANMRHLWVLNPGQLPFAWRRKS